MSETGLSLGNKSAARRTRPTPRARMAAIARNRTFSASVRVAAGTSKSVIAHPSNCSSKRVRHTDGPPFLAMQSVTTAAHDPNFQISETPPSDRAGTGAKKESRESRTANHPSLKTPSRPSPREHREFSPDSGQDSSQNPRSTRPKLSAQRVRESIETPRNHEKSRRSAVCKTSAFGVYPWRSVS